MSCSNEQRASWKTQRPRDNCHEIMWKGLKTSASVIPEAHRTVEATAGVVMFIDIPEDREDLRERFHPDNYPVWSYRRGESDEYASC